MSRERTPLLTRRGAKLLTRLLEHPDAPRWTYAAGDRLRESDLEAVEAFREALSRRSASLQEVIPSLEAAIPRVPRLRDAIPAGTDLEAAWESLPTSSRADLAAEPWTFVPDDAPLDRLVIYRTAGTTGHPVSTPQHPRAIACYLPLLERALGRHGARIAPDPDAVACFLVSSQIRTYTYATVLSAWQGAGFAKLNLRATEWRTPDGARRYFEAFSPPLVNGDPVAFGEMLRLGLPARPVALVSTSTALSPALKKRLERGYGCPAIDWYSSVETGPIASSCRVGALHVLPHDLYVETLGPDGRPAESGEVTVSGGRNPFLPLLRYRTGDHARLVHAPCPCGDPAPRLVGLEGRAHVLFRARDGTPVSTVDVSRVLREFPLFQHAFEQRADRSCVVRVRPLPGSRVRTPALRAALRKILGAVRLDVRVEPRLGQARKVVPWRSRA